MKHAMKVLFLSAWYPTKRDAMAGLFVQKHAEAVAQQGADVRVLYSEATGVRWLWEMARAWKRLHSEWGVPDVVQMNVLDKNGVLALYLRRRYRIPFVILSIGRDTYLLTSLFGAVGMVGLCTILRARLRALCLSVALSKRR